MADERKLYAAQLGHDQIDHRIRVSVKPNGAVVEDKLKQVVHGDPRVKILLENISQRSIFNPGDFIWIEPNEVVTVLD